jgi:hypothetical protein
MAYIKYYLDSNYGGEIKIDERLEKGQENTLRNLVNKLERFYKNSENASEHIIHENLAIIRFENYVRPNK